MRPPTPPVRLSLQGCRCFGSKEKRGKTGNSLERSRMNMFYNYKFASGTGGFAPFFLQAMSSCVAT